MLQAKYEHSETPPAPKFIITSHSIRRIPQWRYFIFAVMSFMLYSRETVYDVLDYKLLKEESVPCSK
jgi:hypothetical protein